MTDPQTIVEGMTRGRYWLTEEPTGDLYIRGRNNRILYRYPAAQRSKAKAHLRKLKLVRTHLEKESKK
jgi:hypothetical protein